MVGHPNYYTREHLGGRFDVVELERRRKLSAVNRGQIPWNLNLTKWEDERVARQGRSCLPGCSCGRHRDHLCSEETKRKISEALLGHAMSTRTRSRISESLSEAIFEGRCRPLSHFKCGDVVTLKGGRFWSRSSWEADYARMLDGDPDVVEFLHEKVKVPYTWMGVEYFTIPDFLVKYTTGGVALVEVKPEPRLDPRERAKLVAVQDFAERYGLGFRWWNGRGYREVYAKELTDARA